MRTRDRILAAAATILAIAAVIEQLSRRPEDRDWHGHVAGVPYDYRMPTIERLLDRVWNPNDERVFVPQVFGLGWTVNLYQLLAVSRQLSADKGVYNAARSVRSRHPFNKPTDS